MLLTRREFLKTSALTAGVAITGMGFALNPVEAHVAEVRKNLQEAVRTTTICPYCGCGCGFVVDSAEDASGKKVV
ncbi:MAG: twin-arginine translocation signal domain-containing protein, partial [Phycisphaerae bacterium]